MKTKVNKLIKLAAVGLFLIALAINVKVTLDDPFVMLSEQAIATGSNGNVTSGNVTSGNSGKTWVLTYCKCPNGYVLGNSNNCHPGFSACNDNDCSRFQISDCP